VPAGREPVGREPAGREPRTADRHRARTWVTRRGVQVDRIASAWLIRRFIDPEARFKFVPGHDYAPRPGEVRFDMFEGEFTHEGDRCTFEVLVAWLAIDDPALRKRILATERKALYVSPRGQDPGALLWLREQTFWRSPSTPIR